MGPGADAPNPEVGQAFVEFVTTDALQNARARPRIPQWSQVESILGDYLQFVLIDQMTPERAVSEAHGRIVAALGR